MPLLLSRTDIFQALFSGCAETLTTGASSPRNLSALPMRAKAVRADIIARDYLLKATIKKARC